MELLKGIGIMIFFIVFLTWLHGGFKKKETVRFNNRFGGRRRRRW